MNEALYREIGYLRRSENDAFDKLHKPGSQTPNSGIYRCEVCGHVVTSVVPHPLPPQNHHQHPSSEPIQWRLIVWG